VAESRPRGVNPSDAFLIPASEIVAHASYCILPVGTRHDAMLLSTTSVMN